MSKKRKAEEHEETEPETKVAEETEEETKEESQEVVEGVETKPEAAVIEAAVIDTTTVAEPKDLPSEDKEGEHEEATEATEETHEEKQATEEILEAATSIVAAETEKAPATSIVAAETEKAPAAAELTEEQIAEQEIRKDIARIFQTATMNSKMDYLLYEQLLDSGGHTLELSDEH